MYWLAFQKLVKLLVKVTERSIATGRAAAGPYIGYTVSKDLWVTMWNLELANGIAHKMFFEV